MFYLCARREQVCVWCASPVLGAIKTPFRKQGRDVEATTGDRRREKDARHYGRCAYHSVRIPASACTVALCALHEVQSKQARRALYRLGRRRAACSSSNQGAVPVFRESKIEHAITRGRTTPRIGHGRTLLDVAHRSPAGLGFTPCLTTPRPAILTTWRIATAF